MGVWYADVEDEGLGMGSCGVGGESNESPEGEEAIFGLLSYEGEGGRALAGETDCVRLKVEVVLGRRYPLVWPCP